MFGYIKPFKPELKVKEFDTYQAFYCGLCRQLGEAFGPFAKLTLSYDFTFLAMVAVGLRQDFCGFGKARCMANPLKKKVCAVPCTDLSFVASCAMILFYHKLRDNLQDSGFWKRLLYYPILPFAAAARKKACRQYAEVDEIFSQMMKEQFALEQAKTPSVDRAAQPTAAAMSKMLQLLAEDEMQKRILERFGYLMGRWVYLMDALDDLEDDRKSKGYNPFLLRLDGQEPTDEKLAEIRQYGKGVLNVTVAELGVTYELLNWQRYKSILDNIVYLGLPRAAADMIARANRKDSQNTTAL
ncbi:MAG: DUF5685 family protein [Candidatus Merdivicinus sp.]|jgi:hypothetical protein